MPTPPAVPPSVFTDVDLARLRQRRSVKWTRHPPDVLPAWVAESDFPLAEPVRAALREAVDRDDTGYVDPGGVGPAGLGGVLAAWAARRGWDVDPDRVRVVADVMAGVAELLRVLTAPGDAVVVEPPVYPPFAATVAEVGRRVVAVPLRRAADGRLRTDLDGVAAAYAAGARAHLLCNPHNPTGTVPTREELTAVAALAERHGVAVLSDEIHAPLTLPGAAHTPWVALDAAAAATGVTLTSASKAWNLAGLKCAVVVAGSQAVRRRLDALPAEVTSRAGHLGVLASAAAWRDGDPWLAGLVAHLDGQRDRLGALLAQHLPGVRWVPPQAGYLAWLDCAPLGLGDDPAAVFLARGRVALSPGPAFGRGGAGHARLNAGTSPALLDEAVRRMARAV